MSTRHHSRTERKSPLRMVCEPPAWARKAHPPRRAGSRQAWGHIFDDPSEPWRNWTDCRWACSRPIRAAVFRQKSDPSTYAVLHPSTKPARRGLLPGPDGRVVTDSRVRRAGGWQLSFFDSFGPRGDVWGASCDGALRRAFGRRGRTVAAAYNARDWRLESIVGASGRHYGRSRREAA